MSPKRSNWSRRAISLAVVPLLAVAACSDGDDDEPDVPATFDGTAVPDGGDGVGGGEPVDNLEDFDTEDDTDGDGEPG